MIKSELLNIITFLVKFTSSTGQKKHLLSILCWKTKSWVYKVKVLKGKQLIGSFLLSTIIILLKVTGELVKRNTYCQFYVENYSLDL